MSRSEHPAEAISFRNAGKALGEVPTQRSLWTIGAAAIGAIAIAAAVNLAAAELLRAHPQNLGYLTVRDAWDRVLGLDEPPEWLVLGDSGCGHAVVPELLEADLGGSVVEACTLGDMGLIDDAWMLGRLIERRGPPGNVVIVHVYDVWQRALPPPGLLAQVPMRPGYWLRLDPSLGLGARGSLDVVAARYLPLVGERRSLKSLARGTLSSTTRPQDIPAGGGQEPSTDTAAVIRDFRRHREFAASTAFAISSVNLQGLNYIAEMADAHGFHVYIANAPLWDGLAADSAFVRYNGSVQDLLRSFAGERPAVTHRGRTDAFELGAMTRTVDHVRPGPAAVYSRGIAEWIALVRSEAEDPE